MSSHLKIESHANIDHFYIYVWLNITLKKVHVLTDRVNKLQKKTLHELC
jgi:hypothetical protein